MTYSHLCLMVIHEHKSDATVTGNAKTDRRQRRSEENRARIFEAAVKLFAKHGFTNVTVEQITEAADVGKGTFFNYFPTKEHLLVAMAELRKDLVAETARAGDWVLADDEVAEVGSITARS